MRQFLLFGVLLCLATALAAQPAPSNINPSAEQQQIGDFLSASLMGNPVAGKTILVVDPSGQIACRVPSAVEADQIGRRSARVAPITSSQMRTTQSAGLTIQLRSTPQLDANSTAKALFVRAAQTWEAIIATPVTVIIDVDYGPTRFGEAWTDPEVLGSADSQGIGSTTAYAQVRSALIAKASDSTETSLLANLPLVSVPTDLGPSTAIHSASSTFRALGLIAAVPNPTAEEPSFGPPPSIGFNSAFPFDLNPDNGITPGQFDFLSVAIHEIGHVLGFGSNAGIRDLDATLPLYLTIHDLFRFRPGVTTGTFATSQRVFSSGGTQVFFGGGLALSLSTGNPKGENGDGRQGSHWKDDSLSGTYLGIMDPTLPSGTSQPITDNDRQAFDRIGWVVSSGGNSNDCQSRTISCGTSVSGTLDQTDCQTTGGHPAEFLYFDATAGQPITVQAASNTLQPYLHLRAPDGTLVAESSTGRIDAVATQSGRWRVQVTSWIAGDFGTYQLTLSCGSVSTICSPASSRFCTQSKRFEVSLSAKDPRTGKTDSGHVMSSSDFFGYFAFPVIAGNTTDPQVFVKVLDGRPVNGKFWVFYASLTDVEFTLRVRDTQTGATKSYYQKPYAQEAANDTNAF